MVEQSHHEGLCPPPPHSVMSDGAKHVVAMLCRHEILMVEEAEEGCGEEAGSDPPGEEGEESPEKQGTEDGPQAPQSH